MQKLKFVIVVPILLKSAVVAESGDAIRQSVRTSQTSDRARVPTTGTIFFPFRFSSDIFSPNFWRTFVVDNLYAFTSLG